MKGIVKKLTAVILAVMMLVTTLAPPALAALVDNTPDQNDKILQELTGFWGDDKTAQEAVELLRENGLIDGEGNVLSDWSGEIYIHDGEEPRHTSVEELTALLEDEAVSRDTVITVDGTEITLGGFETILEIQREIARIRETYLKDEVSLSREQAESLYSLYEQLSEEGIALYNTKGADDLVFPSGVNHHATVSMNVESNGDAVYTVSGAADNQEVSFDFYVIPASASAVQDAKKEHVTITGNGSRRVSPPNPRTPDGWGGQNIWNGEQAFYYYATNIKNAVFEGGKLSHTEELTYSNNANFPTKIEVSASSSKTVNFTDAQKYFLKNLASHYDWSITPSGQKADTVFFAESKKVNKVNSYVSYYQYLSGAISFAGTNVCSLSLGFPGSINDLRTAAKNNTSKVNSAALGYINNKLADSNFSFFPLASGSSWSTRIEKKSGNSVALTSGMKNAGSASFTADGRWGEVVSRTGTDTATSYLNSDGTITVTAALTIKDSVKPTVTGVAFPTGMTFPMRAQVPVTVTFSEPVQSSGVKLTANSKTLSARESNTTAKQLTFLYPVETIGETRVEVTQISGAKDAAGNTMNAASGSWRSESILSTLTLEEAFPRSSVQNANVEQVKYYEPTADCQEKTTATVRVDISLPTNNSLRDLTTPAYMDGSTFYSSVLAGSIDGGETLIPLMLDNSDNPTKLTATVELDAKTLMDQQDFVMEFYTIDESTHQSTGLLFGRYAAFSVNKPVPLMASSLSIKTPTGWPTGPIYASEPPAAEQLTLQAVVNAPQGTTWTQTRWVSSDEKVATIDDDGRVYPLSAGTVSFYLEAVNGGLTEYGVQRSQPVSLTIQQGAQPYLRIPQEKMTIRAGDPLTVRWASNLVQKNMEYGDPDTPTTFTLTVTGTDGQQVGQPYTITYDPATPDGTISMGDGSSMPMWTKGEDNKLTPNQSFSISGLTNTDAKGYTVTLSASADAKVPGEKELKAEAHVTVISKPVTVRLARPGNLFQTNTGTLNVNYTLTNYDSKNNAAFELVVTNNADNSVVYKSITTGDTGGSFPLNLAEAKIQDNFRTIYDVSIKAKNVAENDWSRSMPLS